MAAVVPSIVFEVVPFAVPSPLVLALYSAWAALAGLSQDHDCLSNVEGWLLPNVLGNLGAPVLARDYRQSR
eukprot:9908567-Karenia_brevis.AAC.1